MFEDPRITAALIGGTVSLVVALLVQFLSARAFRTSIFENTERTLIEKRLERYPQLMQDLRPLSFNANFKKVDYDATKLKQIAYLNRSDLTEVIEAINVHIFSLTGLVLSHESREMLIRLRFIIEKWLQIEKRFGRDHSKLRDACRDVTEASWKVHQMLRADLGVHQPVLQNALDKIQRQRLSHVKQQDIERLARQIEHVDWRGMLRKE